jgi:exodeoxyribonuclease-3
MANKMLKIMTFNILAGGGDESRFGGILEIIRHTQPDVLVMQECLGWEDGERLKLVAHVMDIPAKPTGSYLGIARPRVSGRRYHVAVASRFPMQNVVTYNSPFFLGHCIVKFEISVKQQTITLFGTHFDARSENLRFVEARYLRSLIDVEAFNAGYYVLMGDLNSLSKRDPYPANLEELLLKSWTTKYHFPPRFEVLEELESFGWIDTLHHHNDQQRKWVTAIRNRGGVRIDYRTDYMFASPEMAEMLVKTDILEAEGVSDHNPVIAIFRL